VSYREKVFRDMVGRHLVEGELEDLLVGKGIADVLGVEAGEVAVLVFPTGIRTPTGFVPKTREVRIGGIFETGAYDRDFVLVFMRDAEARRFFKRGFRFEGIEVYVEDPYGVQEIKKEIERRA